MKYNSCSKESKQTAQSNGITKKKGKQAGEMGLNTKTGKTVKQVEKKETECRGIMKAELCPTPEAIVLSDTHTQTNVCNKDTRP